MILVGNSRTSYDNATLHDGAWFGRGVIRIVCVVVLQLGSYIWDMQLTQQEERLETGKHADN